MYKIKGFNIYQILIISLLLQLSKQKVFDLIQTITAGSSDISSIDISENNHILVIGTYDNKVLIYKNDNSKYIPDQIIPFKSQVDAVDITSDGKYLLVVQYEGRAKIYKYDQASGIFIVLQQINDFTFTWSGIISDDHQQVIIGDQFGTIFIYKFNGTNYNQVQNMTDTSNDIRYLSGSRNLQYFVSSQLNILRIYKKQQNKNFDIFQQIQFQNSSTIRRAFITQDFEYISVNADEKNINIYQFDENNYQLNNSAAFTGSYKYASLSSKNNLLGISGIPTIVAEYQTLLDIYPVSLFNIFSKNQKYFITGDQFGRVSIYQNSNIFQQVNRSLCDTNNNYYQQEGQCLYCNPIQNKFLLIRVNTSDDISFAQCLSCDLQGCQSCDSLSICRQCQDGYSLDGYLCKKDFQLSLILIIVGLVLILIVFVLLCAIIACLVKRNNEDQKKQASDEKILKENQNITTPIESNRQMVKQQMNIGTKENI